MPEILNPTKNFHRITAKDVMTLMGCNLSTAKRYLADIKQEKEIKVVLVKHWREYFKV